MPKLKKGTASYSRYTNGSHQKAAGRAWMAGQNAKLVSKLSRKPPPAAARKPAKRVGKDAETVSQSGRKWIRFAYNQLFMRVTYIPFNESTVDQVRKNALHFVYPHVNTKTGY